MLSELQKKILKRLIENLPQSASQLVHLTDLDERSLVINAVSGLDAIGFTKSAIPFSGVLALITDKGIEHMDSLKAEKAKPTAKAKAAPKKTGAAKPAVKRTGDNSAKAKAAPKKTSAVKTANPAVKPASSKANKGEIKVKIIAYDTVYNAVKKSKLLETEKNELNGMIASVEQLMKAEKKDKRKIWMKIKSALEFMGTKTIDAGLAFALVPYFAQAMNGL